VQGREISCFLPARSARLDTAKIPTDAFRAEVRAGWALASLLFNARACPAPPLKTEIARMASSKLAVARMEASQRLASARRSQKAKAMEHGIVRHATGLTTGAILGTMRRMHVPATIGGFPWKLGLAGAAVLGEAFTKGAMQAALSGVGIATMAIYSEASIATDSLVAGSGGQV
jgi:hypothetical protein